MLKRFACQIGCSWGKTPLRLEDGIVNRADRQHVFFVSNVLSHLQYLSNLNSFGGICLFVFARQSVFIFVSVLIWQLDQKSTFLHATKGRPFINIACVKPPAAGRTAQVHAS